MIGSRDELEKLLESSKGKKVVLNVSSSKCGPCKLLMPTLQKYADEHGGDKCTFAKFNFDEDKSLQEAVKEWKIQGVPTYMMYDENGECTKMFTTGLPDKLGSALYLFLT
jgi:thiol-disulfide isomerase/thioredoxin